MILVVVLVFVFTRNLKKGLLLLLPLAVTVVLTFGIMGWFNVKINIMNCLVIIFIFGLVVDYAVFLISSIWEKSSSETKEFRNRSSSAILLSSLTTLAGLGVLILARHPALFTLGLSAVIGISCGLFSVFLIIPFLGKKLARK